MIGKAERPQSFKDTETNDLPVYYFVTNRSEWTDKFLKIISRKSLFQKFSLSCKRKTDI